MSKHPRKCFLPCLTLQQFALNRVDKTLINRRKMSCLDSMDLSVEEKVTKDQVKDLYRRKEILKFLARGLKKPRQWKTSCKKTKERYEGRA